MRIHGQAAALRHLAGRNGQLLLWPPILALQGFGIAWNVGVIAALLLRMVFTDIAFGWESTWVKSPEVPHALVRDFPLPWTWFLPEACPTLDQMNQTWFRYASGIKELGSDVTR